MREVRWLWPVALIVLLVIGAGTWQRTDGADHLRRWLIYGPEEDAGATETLVIRRNGDRLVAEFDGETWEVGRLAKTQVYDGVAEVSGTLSMLNQDEQFYISAPTALVELQAGSVRLWIEDVSTGYTGPDPQPDPPAGTEATFVVGLEIGYGGITDGIEDHYFVYFQGGGPWNIEVPYSISTSGRRLTREETTTPGAGRQDAPCYASEVKYADTWAALPNPLSYDVTFGSMHYSGTQTWDATYEEWDPQVTAISAVEFAVEQHKGNAGIKYAALELEWDGVCTDLSRFFRDLGAWRWEGVADGVEVLMDETVGALNDSHTATVQPPYILDFEDFGVWDRDGALAENLCIDGPLQASNHCAASLGWSTTPDGQTTGSASPGDKVYPTVKQLRDLGSYIDPPTVTGLDYRDPDDSYRLLTSNVLSFGLTEESVEHYVATYGHETDDLTIELRVPGLDATTCDANPDWDGGINISHPTARGVYGPEPALDHTDWSGSGGVSSPNAGGDFTVTGNGSLTLTFPSNYGSRLDAVPDENFPDGMPGIPDIAFYHRADKWREYDGEADQSGGTWSEPAEARYCGRGWPCLRLPFPEGADSTLTVTLTYLTHSYTDNHHTDSTRQTECVHTSQQHTATYSVDYRSADGEVYVYLAAPEEGGEPDLEQVTQIAISGFVNGTWRLEEPGWALDPSEDITTHTVVKAFEGPDYRDGGLSAAVDSVCHTALMDTTEDNGGHDNVHETSTVRTFDYRVGATSGLDFTVAYSLGQQASRINSVCDAWDASLNSALLDTKTLDEESARLTNGYAFDICAPLDAGTPLLQSADSGSLNVALRCGSWQIVRGIKYKLWPDKIIGGALHGQLVSGATLRRTTDGPNVDRYTGSAWETVEQITSNAAGYWKSGNLEVTRTYTPSQAFWQYRVGSTSGLYVRAREYSYVTASVLRALWPHLVEGVHSRLYLTYAGSDGKARWRYKMFGDKNWASEQKTGYEADAPTIGYDRRLWRIYLLHGQEEALATQARSDNNEWEDSSASLGALKYPLSRVVGDRLYVIGYSGGYQVLTIYKEGIVETVNIAPSDEKPATLIKSRDYGYLLASTSSGEDTTFWVSWEDGQAGSWQQAFSETDWLYPTVWDDGLRLYISGYEPRTGNAIVRIRHADDFESYAEGRVTVASCDAQRPPVVKMGSARAVVMAVPQGGQIKLYESWRDGREWTLAETMAVT